MAHRQGTLIGCPDCDLLISYQPNHNHYDARCPRCQALLVKAGDNSFKRTRALSFSGICLFVPACFLPLMKLNMFGYEGTCTMVKGVTQMIKDGYLCMAMLVLFCSILVPLFIQILLLGITLLIRSRRFRKILIPALKIYQRLTEWAMLDVYMLGILIALVKMQDYGDLFSGPGLYCFIGVMLFVTLSMLSFDTARAWDMLEGRAS